VDNSAGPDSLRFSRDTDKVHGEVLQHLAGLPGVQVTLSPEIQVEVPEGVGEGTVRTVTENSAER